MKDLAGTDLEDLLASAARGDQDAVNHILRTITPLIVRYCRSRLGRARSSYQSADDIAQEVCLAVVLALPRYHEQGRPFLAYVYRIAANKVVDAHRAETRRRSDPNHPPADPTRTSTRPDQVQTAPPHGYRLVHGAQALDTEQSTFPKPEDYTLQLESLSRTRELLDLLPERQREVLILRVVNGFSAEETAQALLTTPGAIRVAQHRALGQLRRALAARTRPPKRTGPAATPDAHRDRPLAG